VCRARCRRTGSMTPCWCPWAPSPPRSPEWRTAPMSFRLHRFGSEISGSDCFCYTWPEESMVIFSSFFEIQICLWFHGQFFLFEFPICVWINGQESTVCWTWILAKTYPN
jgi:hypothetical protein